MKTRLSSLSLALSLVLLMAGCGSSGSVRQAGTIRANLGTSARSVLVSETVSALAGRYGFLMLRQVVDTEDVRFETDWKQESALADERAAGYTHARTKITVTARPRNRSSSGAQNLVVSFFAETQVMGFGKDIWEFKEPTPERRDLIDEISNHLRRTYQTALR